MLFKRLKTTHSFNCKGRRTFPEALALMTVLSTAALLPSRCLASWSWSLLSASATAFSLTAGSEESEPCTKSAKKGMKTKSEMPHPALSDAGGTGAPPRLCRHTPSGPQCPGRPSWTEPRSNTTRRSSRGRPQLRAGPAPRCGGQPLALGAASRLRGAPGPSPEAGSDGGGGDSPPPLHPPLLPSAPLRKPGTAAAARRSLTEGVHPPEEALEVALLLLVRQHGRAGTTPRRRRRKLRGDAAVAMGTTPAGRALDAASAGGALGGVAMQMSGWALAGSGAAAAAGPGPRSAPAEPPPGQRSSPPGLPAPSRPRLATPGVARGRNGRGTGGSGAPPPPAPGCPRLRAPRARRSSGSLSWPRAGGAAQHPAPAHRRCGAGTGPSVRRRCSERR